MRLLRALMLLGLAACSSEIERVTPIAGSSGEVPSGSTSSAAGGASSGSTSSAGGAVDPCSSGKALWARAFGGEDFDTGEGVAVARDGRVAVAGSFEGTTDLGFGQVVSAGETDALIAVLTGDGEPLWAKTPGGPSIDTASGVAFAPDGNLLVAGSTFDPIDLGAGVLTADGPAIFAASYESDGDHTWSTVRLGPGFYMSDRIATDGAAGATFGAWFSTPPDAWGAEKWPLAIRAGASGAIVWELFNLSGWAEQLLDLEHDGVGGAFLVGSFRDTFDVGAGVHQAIGDYANAFVVRVAADGVPVWSKAFGSPGQAGEVAVAGDGSILVTATLDNRVTVDGVTLSGYLLIKLDPNGQVLWARDLSGISLNALAVNAQGEIAIGVVTEDVEPWLPGCTARWACGRSALTDG